MDKNKSVLSDAVGQQNNILFHTQVHKERERERESERERKRERERERKRERKTIQFRGLIKIKNEFFY